MEVTEKQIAEFIGKKFAIRNITNIKLETRQCNICSIRLKYDSRKSFGGETAHIDHIHPFSKRDSYPKGKEKINELSNLQALCPSCNLDKSNKEIQ